jgi:hypothetical protein
VCRGLHGKGEPQSVLKPDECSIVLELGHEGKFVAQIKRLRSKPGFPEGDKLAVAVKDGRWLLSHTPTKPQPPEPVRH